MSHLSSPSHPKPTWYTLQLSSASSCPRNTPSIGPSCSQKAGTSPARTYAAEDTLVVESLRRASSAPFSLFKWRQSLRTWNAFLSARHREIITRTQIIIHIHLHSFSRLESPRFAPTTKCRSIIARGTTIKLMKCPGEHVPQAPSCRVSPSAHLNLTQAVRFLFGTRSAGHPYSWSDRPPANRYIDGRTTSRWPL